MANEQTLKSSLRLWPAKVALVLFLIRYIVPVIVPSTGGLGILAGAIGVLIVVVWWLFFSRAAWSERLAAIALIAVALAATSRFVHMSITGGMMGLMLWVYGVPSMCFALATWAIVTNGMRDGLRRAALVAAVLTTGVVWTLLRTDGIISGGSQFAWRWTPTAEERLLAMDPAPLPGPVPAATPIASAPVDPGVTAPPAAPAIASPTAPAIPPASDVVTTAAGSGESGSGRIEWPGFRGPARDAVVHGVRIDTDWSTSPPKEIWRRPIGPGWSSFAVHGNLVYTQEQRGDDEVVSCYELATGKPVWMHRDKIRFWESNGGAGPRATPTLAAGRVYAMGATGMLNALDAKTGAVIWARNAAKDTGATLPGWGFAGSPLVVGDLVIVATSGKMAGFDAATGTPRWIGPAGLAGYSSPHLMTIDGVAQIVLVNGSGTTSVSPVDGTVLWQHAWAPGGAAIVQPAQMPEGDVVINAIAMTGGQGTRRLALKQSSPAQAGSAPSGSAQTGWTVEERWTSNGLKPYFNDFVLHKGHAYGFDGSILASIDLATGKRNWKGGRYGEGQLLLLADQDVLLVLSEEGDVALVGATTDQFKEITRFKAVEGKTWNHPVVVGDMLLVRNGEEMAAFRLQKVK